jgi:mRNA m6A methyltransferase non-catalytic subunit
VIIWEGSPTDPSLKPPELYQLVENFCLGTRRLELFGRAASVRRGWVTALAAGQDSPSALAAAGIQVKERPAGEEESEEDGRRMEVEVDEEGRERVVVRNVERAEDDGEGGTMGVRKWEREAWEKEVAELANGGKQVVTMNAGEWSET